VSGQFYDPAALHPEKELPVPIGKEPRRAPEPVWAMRREEKYYPYRDSNSDSLAVQVVASRYTDYASRASDNI
jgi:hypothetical protein